MSEVTWKASVSMFLDWDTIDAKQVGQMDTIRALFTNVTLDTYARSAETKAKLWIIEGTTTKNYLQVAQQLADVFMMHSVERLAVHQVQ